MASSQEPDPNPGRHRLAVKMPDSDGHLVLTLTGNYFEFSQRERGFIGRLMDMVNDFRLDIEKTQNGEKPT